MDRRQRHRPISQKPAVTDRRMDVASGHGDQHITVSEEALCSDLLAASTQFTKTLPDPSGRVKYSEGDSGEFEHPPSKLPRLDSDLAQDGAVAVGSASSVEINTPCKALGLGR